MNRMVMDAANTVQSKLATAAHKSSQAAETAAIYVLITVCSALANQSRTAQFAIPHILRIPYLEAAI